MNDANRRRLLLGAVAVALVILAVRQLGPLLANADGGPLPSRRADRGGASPAEAFEWVELAQLAAEPEAEHQVTRDPFRFGELPRPAPPPVRLPPPPVHREPDPPQPVYTGPQLPPVDLTFLGSFGPRKRRIAVLTDGVSLLNVRSGDEIQGTFRVEKIGYESVDLSYVEFPDEPPVRLEVGN